MTDKPNFLQESAEYISIQFSQTGLDDPSYKLGQLIEHDENFFIVTEIKWVDCDYRCYVKNSDSSVCIFEEEKTQMQQPIYLVRTYTAKANKLKDMEMEKLYSVGHKLKYNENK